MSEVRFAIVGFGNIGQVHAGTLLGGAVERARLTAIVSGGKPELPDGVVCYETLAAMLADDVADAVIVATPTMSHPQISRAVLAARRHLVLEKPVAMSALEARALVSEVPAGICAAVMLNQRYHPVYREIKNVVARGDIGHVSRFNWIMTAWYRPNVYYHVSNWRGTWPGEGGGALLNQCIHNLDILHWLLGMPASVYADVHMGKFHDIDVEDEVTAMLSYGDGATGVVVASTGEAPGVNRLDIVGDRGTLHYDGTTLVLARAGESVAEHCRTTNEMFGMPDFATQPVPIGPELNQHACVLQNVVDAILDGSGLATSLAEGVGAIELANAMLLSGWEARRVDLPLDDQRYQKELDERIAASSLREAKNIDVHVDMDASYR